MLRSAEMPIRLRRRRRHKSRGAALVEYCLILSVLLMAMIAGVHTLGCSMKQPFNQLGTTLQSGAAK